MAFNGDNMTPLGGNSRAGANAANAPMGWAYQSTTDDLATVLASGYFNTFHLFLVAGQFIYVNLTDQKAFITIKSVDNGLKQVVIDAFAIGALSVPFPVEIFNGTAKNLVVDDTLNFFVMNNAATQTVTIPENASQAFQVGAEMEFLREGVGTVTFAVSGAAVLQSRAGLVDINAQYSAATLKKNNIYEWRLIGDLA